MTTVFKDEKYTLEFYEYGFGPPSHKNYASLYDRDFKTEYFENKEEAIEALLNKDIALESYLKAMKLKNELNEKEESMTNDKEE